MKDIAIQILIIVLATAGLVIAIEEHPPLPCDVEVVCR